MKDVDLTHPDHEFCCSQLSKEVVAKLRLRSRVAELEAAAKEVHRLYFEDRENTATFCEAISRLEHVVAFGSATASVGEVPCSGFLGEKSFTCVEGTRGCDVHAQRASDACAGCGGPLRGPQHDYGDLHNPDPNARCCSKVCVLKSMAKHQRTKEASPEDDGWTKEDVRNGRVRYVPHPKYGPRKPAGPRTKEALARGARVRSSSGPEMATVLEEPTIVVHWDGDPPGAQDRLGLNYFADTPRPETAVVPEIEAWRDVGRQLVRAALCDDEPTDIPGPIVEQVQSLLDGSVEIPVTCHRCWGDGYVTYEGRHGQTQCWRCKGTGQCEHPESGVESYERGAGFLLWCKECGAVKDHEAKWQAPVTGSEER